MQLTAVHEPRTRPASDGRAFDAVPAVDTDDGLDDPAVLEGEPLEQAVAINTNGTVAKAIASFGPAQRTPRNRGAIPSFEFRVHIFKDISATPRRITQHLPERCGQNYCPATRQRQRSARNYSSDAT